MIERPFLLSIENRLLQHSLLRSWFFYVLLPGFSSVVYAQQIVLPVSDFSSNSLDGWKTRVFDGETTYSLVKDEGQTVLKAISQDSASGLFKAITVDLDKTPFLNWRWKISGTLGAMDEHTKAGDDYAARVYVVFSGTFFWNTRAVNYVWSSNQPAGSRWENAYTGNAQMIAVQSATDVAGTWVTVRRDVRQDFKDLFGEKISQADGVAIMTDTDNSDQSAVAWYGELYFSADPVDANR